MAKHKGAPHRAISFRISETLYAEMILLKPELQDVEGRTKHGGMKVYLNRLIREDLERVKAAIKQGGAR